MKYDIGRMKQRGSIYEQQRFEEIEKLLVEIEKSPWTLLQNDGPSGPAGPNDLDADV